MFVRLHVTARICLLLVATISVPMLFGCAADQYHYGTGSSFHSSGDVGNSVSYGVPHARVDRLERIVQTPRKWLRKISNRPETDAVTQEQLRNDAVELAQDYLAANGLDEVHIDVRVYQPREQWMRLKENPNIRPIWKYTGGTLNWLRYTILPMRAFHSDRYDPFTNTLSINSINAHQVLFETALAKEFHRHRRLRIGGYAMLQFVPFVPLYHNIKASSDALTYSEHHLDGEFTDELYPLAYSRIGSTVVSEALSVVSISPNAPVLTGPLLRVAGGTIGRWTGKGVAGYRDQAFGRQRTGSFAPKE